MSYEQTQASFNALNGGLSARYNQGRPIKLEVEGHPRLDILSFTPLVYERYGSFFKRGPYVAGLLALRAFLTVPHPDGGVLVYAGVEAGGHGYGFPMDGYNPETNVVIESVARQLGQPLKLK